MAHHRLALPAAAVAAALALAACGAASEDAATPAAAPPAPVATGPAAIATAPSTSVEAPAVTQAPADPSADPSHPADPKVLTLDVPAATGPPVLTTTEPDVGEPPADTPADADACVTRWNAPANAAGRADALRAGAPSGAWVRLVHEPAARCAIWIAHVGVDGAARYYEVADGRFLAAQGGSPLAAPPERVVDPDGTLGGAVRPGLPRAVVRAGASAVIAGLGSSCWTAGGQGVCVDTKAPECGDGSTPRLLVAPGEAVTFVLPFTPADPPALGVEDGAESVALERSATPTWTPDLPAGRHAVSLFVRDGVHGDVAYTVCVDIAG